MKLPLAPRPSPVVCIFCTEDYDREPNAAYVCSVDQGRLYAVVCTRCQARGPTNGISAEQAVLDWLQPLDQKTTRQVIEAMKRRILAKMLKRPPEFPKSEPQEPS